MIRAVCPMWSTKETMGRVLDRREWLKNLSPDSYEIRVYRFSGLVITFHNDEDGLAFLLAFNDIADLFTADLLDDDDGFS